MAKRNLAQTRFLNCVRPVICKEGRLFGRSPEVKAAQKAGILTYKGQQGCRVNGWHCESASDYPGVLISAEELEKITLMMSESTSADELTAQTEAQFLLENSWPVK